MAHLQIIADWMANIRHSRRMDELFGQGTEVDITEGKCSPVVPRKIILTTSSSTNLCKVTEYEFLRQYPALMDPRNFIRLISKYTTANILLWANNGRPQPILNSHQIYELRNKATKLMGEHTPGSEDTLLKIIDIVKSHNRLDNMKHKYTCISPDVVCLTMNAWYDCISLSTSTDFATLPLYFAFYATARKLLTLLLRNDGYLRMSLILSELLHDPLFPYHSLQDIPDRVLLEWCVSHSYPHVLDKLKVNSSSIETTQDDIKARVEALIQAPVRWLPEDDVDQDDAMSISGESIDSTDALFIDDDDKENVKVGGSEPAGEHFQPCGNCVDDGVSDCRSHVRATRSGAQHIGLRQPGELCIQRETLGEPCEDRSTRKRHGSLTSQTFKKNYHRYQKAGGHMGERVEDNKRLRNPFAYRGYAARIQLYPLLLSGASRRQGNAAKVSVLCLPQKKPDEGKIRLLVENISNPHDNSDLPREQAALLSASRPNQKAAVHGDVHKGDEDDEMDDADSDDDEEWTEESVARVVTRTLELL